MRKTIIFHAFWRPFAFIYTQLNDGFYFRFFGKGLCVINRKIKPASFSVRNGYKKELRIGKYGIKFLT